MTLSLSPTFVSFVLIPWLCALSAALAAAPLGCLLGWRRLVYFGEALSHASLLGIALSLYLHWPLTLGIWLVTLLLIGLLYLLQRSQRENPSNILGSLAHISLALGLILLTRLENIRTDLLSYLYGDILATSGRDLLLITAISLGTLLALRWLWAPLLLLTLNPAMAYSERPTMKYVDLAYLFLLGSYIALMVQYFGLLLVVALLIIPANAANRLARTPEQSAALATLLALVAASLGTAAAWQWNLALAPAIIAAAGLFYFGAVLLDWLRRPN